MMRAAANLEQASIELHPEVDEKIAQNFPNAWQTLQQHRTQDANRFQLLHEVLWYELKVREANQP